MRMIPYVCMLLLPLATTAVADEKAPSALEACKGRAEFLYHFEMMQIERSEINGTQLYSMVEAAKQKRHLQFVGELAVCEEEHGKK